MGVSTDAILFYGYAWSDQADLVPFLPEDGGWEELIARRRGHVNPWDEWVEPAPQMTYAARERLSKKWSDDNRTRLDGWYKAKADVKAEFGVDIHSHCSGDYPMPYIAVNDSHLCASRGNPQEVEKLQVGPDWNDKLIRFAAELGIALPEGGPKWWLVSYWC